MNSREKFEAWWRLEGTFCDNPFTSKKDTAIQCWQTAEKSRDEEVALLKARVRMYENVYLAVCPPTDAQVLEWDRRNPE